MRWVLPLFALLIVACSRQEAPTASMVAPAELGRREQSAVEAEGGGASRSGNAVSEPLVITTAQMDIRSSDPQDAARQAERVTRDAEGFVLTSQLSAIDGDPQVLQLQLRVPRENLDELLDKLRALGTVLEESIQGEDVTEEFVDVSARLQAARALEARLLTLVERSSEISDLLKVEQELARIRGDIEAKEGRVRYLKEHARLSAVTFTARTPDRAVAHSSESLRSQFRSAAYQSARLGIEVTKGSIVALGFVIPLGLLGSAVFAPVALWRRRRKRAATAGATE